MYCRESLSAGSGHRESVLDSMLSMVLESRPSPTYHVARRPRGGNCRGEPDAVTCKQSERVHTRFRLKTEISKTGRPGYHRMVRTVRCRKSTVNKQGSQTK